MKISPLRVGSFLLFVLMAIPLVAGVVCTRPSHRYAIGISDESFRARYGELLPYFDAAYCASRIKCSMFISCGYIDSACHPGSVYCIYNAITAPKRMFEKVEYGHSGGPPEYMKTVDDWLRSFVDR